MNRSWDVIIVGAGPAGAMMAYELAVGGMRVAVFDPSHPREKPCAGFLDKNVFDLHPLLEAFKEWYLYEGERTFVAPSGRSFTLSKQEAITTLNVCSRKIFDLYLIQSAEQAGANWFKEKILKITKKNNKWELITKNKTYTAPILIGADGGRSLVRDKLAVPFAKKDLVLARGNVYEGETGHQLHVVFIKNGGVGFLLPGYGLTQIVVGQRLPNSNNINKNLKFLVNYLPGDWTSPNRTWAALQPAPVSRHFFKQKCSGEDYCLIGDAAGHSHPVKCEGILYALHGAILAAECCLEGRLSDFDTCWRDIYGKDLEKKAVQLRRAPGEWSINIAAWALSKSNRLKGLAAKEMANKNKSFFSTFYRAGSQIPQIMYELISR